MCRLCHKWIWSPTEVGGDLDNESIPYINELGITSTHFVCLFVCLFVIAVVVVVVGEEVITFC